MMRILFTLLTAEVPANKLPNLRHNKQICGAEKICQPEQHNKQPEPGQAIQTYTAALLSSAQVAAGPMTWQSCLLRVK
jgi:hypothetical protein